jgi:hypothetical protein
MMYFSCNVSFSSLPVFLPTILNEMGFSAVNAQGLSAPPYFLAFLLVILSTYIADRTQQRGLVIMALSALGAVGYILLVSHHPAQRFSRTHIFQRQQLLLQGPVTPVSSSPQPVSSLVFPTFFHGSLTIKALILSVALVSPFST